LATAISVLLPPPASGGAGGIGGAISLLVKSWEGLGKLSLTCAWSACACRPSLGAILDLACSMDDDAVNKRSTNTILCEEAMKTLKESLGKLAIYRERLAS
jgi:hypothetical protein